MRAKDIVGKTVAPFDKLPVDAHREAHTPPWVAHERWLAGLNVGDHVLVIEHTGTMIGGGATRIIGPATVSHLKANGKAVTVNGRGYSRLTGISKTARGGAYWFAIINPDSAEATRLHHRRQVHETRDRITERLRRCNDLGTLTQIETILNTGAPS